MALTNAPLLGTRHDEQMFVDRTAERAELLRNVQTGWNTLVLGPTGIGKTSLLNRFAADLENSLEAHPETGRQLFPFRVTGQPASAADFFQTLAGQMIDRLQQGGVVAKVLQTAHHALEQLRSAGFSGFVSRPTDEHNTTAELMQTLRLIGLVVDELCDNGLDAVILVDELASSEIAQTLFGRMRDELWTLHARWIVAGRSSDSQILLMAPADTFFERRLNLGPLTHAEAVALLRARLQHEAVLEVSDEEIDQLAQVGQGHPLALVVALRAVASGTPTSELIERSQHIAASLERLSPPAQRLARLILHRAQPARATDEGLLRQTGWTSSRLRQVLHELANAGVLDVVDAETQGPGRPSKAYVPSITRHDGFRDTPTAVAMMLAGKDEADGRSDVADGS
jgi:hypothetical protein